MTWPGWTILKCKQKRSTRPAIEPIIHIDEVLSLDRKNNPGSFWWPVDCSESRTFHPLTLRTGYNDGCLEYSSSNFIILTQVLSGVTLGFAMCYCITTVPSTSGFQDLGEKIHEERNCWIIPLSCRDTSDSVSLLMTTILVFIGWM